MDLSVCYETPSGNIITPKGRLSYAQYLLEPQENDNGKLMYSCSLLLPPGSDFKLLKKAMVPIAMQNLDNDKAKAKAAVERRFLDPNNLPGGGKPAGEEFEGWTLLRMSSKFKPDLIFPNGKPMAASEEGNEVYSGRWARVSVNPYWFKSKANSGVTVGLQNVQLLDHDDNIGGGKPKGEGEFGAVSDEGGSSKSADTDDGDLDDLFD